MDTGCRKHADDSERQCTETHDCIQDMQHQGKDHPHLTGREENSPGETEKGARFQFCNSGPGKR